MPRMEPAPEERDNPEVRLVLADGRVDKDGVPDDNMLAVTILRELPPALAPLVAVRPVLARWPLGCAGSPQAHIIASAAPGGADTSFAPGMNSVWALHEWAARRGVFVDLRAALGAAREPSHEYIRAEAAAHRRARLEADGSAGFEGAPTTKEDMERAAKELRRVVTTRDAATFVPELLVVAEEEGGGAAR